MLILPGNLLGRLSTRSLFVKKMNDLVSDLRNFQHNGFNLILNSWISYSHIRLTVFVMGISS